MAAPDKELKSGNKFSKGKDDITKTKKSLLGLESELGIHLQFSSPQAEHARGLQQGWLALGRAARYHRLGRGCTELEPTPARPASPSIPPASRPPCSSASASWRTRGRSRDPSGVRDAVPDPRGHLRLLRRRRPGLGSLRRRRQSPGRSPAAPRRGSSSGGSRSSLSRTTTRV